MRNRTVAWAALALTLTALTPAPAEGPSKREGKKGIGRLIEQLGSDDFDARESATRQLEKLGQPALGQLRKALRGDDLEVRRRASRLVERITGRIARTDVKEEAPPKGAVVLFGGEGLDAWVGRDGVAKPSWRVGGGVMEASDADIRTRETFGAPYRLHIELRIPADPPDTPYGRGNSGVYLHGNYEIQILDSYQVAPNAPRVVHSKPTESCGSIFGRTAPLVNACKAPGYWQSFDVELTPPRYDGGKKVADAVVTVRHNGELIHDKVTITGPTGGLGLGGDLSEPAPVMLQYHRCIHEDAPHRRLRRAARNRSPACGVGHN